jgi:uncharacterized protein (DUF924 family)
MDAKTDLLAFWFDERSRQRWFDPDPAFDKEVASRFGHLLEELAEGNLKGWESTAEGALALCLVLDQLPRNVHRGTPAAFAHDEQARAVADRALQRGYDRQLPFPHRMFLYLPFEHSEDLADQDRAVALFEDLGDPDGLDFAKKHRRIIARFGRFPHRNRILGRESTPEEEAFLKEPDSSF